MGATASITGGLVGGVESGDTGIGADGGSETTGGEAGCETGVGGGGGILTTGASCTPQF